MDINPWIPNLLGLVVLFLGCCLTLFIPETLNYQHETLIVKFAHEEPLLDAQGSTPVFAIDPDSRLTPTRTSLVSRLQTRIRNLAGFLAEDWRVPALILPFVVCTIASVLNSLLIQYASVHYHITFSKATLILSIRAGFMVFTFLAVIPGILHFITSRSAMDGKQKDLYLVRASFIISCIGWCLIAAAPTLGLFVAALIVATLGAGQIALTRSFLTGLVKPHDVAKLYMVISLVNTLALMGGGPLMAGLFEIGLERGGVSIGLPFWFIGGLYAFIVGLVFVVGAEKRAMFPS